MTFSGRSPLFGYPHGLPNKLCKRFRLPAFLIPMELIVIYLFIRVLA